MARGSGLLERHRVAGRRPVRNPFTGGGRHHRVRHEPERRDDLAGALELGVQPVVPRPADHRWLRRHLRRASHQQPDGSRDVGFRDSPSQVSSTVAGQAYNLSVWVRSEVAGRTINLKAREVTSSGSSPGALTQPYLAPDTAWHRIALTYVARGTGNDLSFVVYATAVGPNQGFWADLFSASVTTPDPSPTVTTATATATATGTTEPTVTATPPTPPNRPSPPR